MTSRFLAILMAMTFLLVQTAEGYARTKSVAYPALNGSLHQATVMVVSETGDNTTAMKIAYQVAVNQAHVSGKSISRIIASVAFQGPRNNPQPWKGKGGLQRFQQAAAVIAPLHQKAMAGQRDVLPPELKRFSNAAHFDSRRHNDWGDYLGQYGNTCFYTEYKSKRRPKDTCTASYGGLKKGIHKNRHGKNKLLIAKKHGKTKVLVARNDNKARKAKSLPHSDVRVASR